MSEAKIDIGYVTPTPREEFEIWARPRCYGLDVSSNGYYTDQVTYFAWQAWQAGVTSQNIPPADSKDIIIRTLRAEVERLCGVLKEIDHYVDSDSCPDPTWHATASRELLARLDKEI